VRRLCVLVVAALVAGGACAGDREMLTVSARFDDVADVAPRAPVMFADVRVGNVKDIRLSGTRALVTMKLDPGADVPRGVVARVRRTSALGERIIDLVAPDDLPAGAPALEDGATIADTQVRADLENLVVEGSEIFGAIGASQLATLVDEGARGFGGRGEQLATLLRNLESITGAYRNETGDIKELVESIDEFNRTMASESEAHSRAVANTARAIEMLDEEGSRLRNAIASLARLATGGRSILDAHADEIDRFFSQSNTIMRTLAEDQKAIRELLQLAPGHNRNTQLVEYAEFNQILQDFVICGLNDNPKDPGRRCKGDK
jgi:phospholipid/cholesterol/gamma-HCH transport system substrate-binding protein